jgi:hypothetical protein
MHGAPATTATEMEGNRFVVSVCSASLLPVPPSCIHIYIQLSSQQGASPSQKVRQNDPRLNIFFVDRGERSVGPSFSSLNMHGSSSCSPSVGVFVQWDCRAPSPFGLYTADGWRRTRMCYTTAVLWLSTP